MSVDSDVLAMLRAVPGLNVHDGDVEVNEADRVIAVDLPYVVFYSSPGYDNDERKCGQVAGRVVEFRIQGVGLTREQARFVLDRARAALSRKRLNGALIRRSDTNIPIRREDTYTAPGNEPLFYGFDEYAVATTGN